MREGEEAGENEDQEDKRTLSPVEAVRSTEMVGGGVEALRSGKSEEEGSVEESMLPTE